MALCSTFTAPAVVGIPGSGNFRPEWVKAFAGLRQVLVIGDNDPAGEKFRARCRALLSPIVDRVIDLRVPDPYNDLDDWRRGCGTGEPELFGLPLFKAAGEAQARAGAA